MPVVAGGGGGGGLVSTGVGIVPTRTIRGSAVRGVPRLPVEHVVADVHGARHRDGARRLAEILDDLLADEERRVELTLDLRRRISSSSPAALTTRRLAALPSSMIAMPVSS